MTDLNIVPMTETHIPQVLEIENSVFSTPWSSDMFHQEIGGLLGSRSYVATVRDRVVGYAVAWFFDDEVHLVNIAVSKSFQTGKVGTMLLTRIVDDALDADKNVITLEVRSSNSGAQSFYRSLRFRTIGVRKGYYTDNREDALLMMLDLASVAVRR